MSSDRLDFLRRKNKGKGLLAKYKEMFVMAGFSSDELTYVDLEETDRLISRVRSVFANVEQEVEILPENSTYVDSNILTTVFGNMSNDECYIFSDDFDICGMYRTNVQSAKLYCLNVAKSGYSNTCFVLDKLFRFSFTINFYLEGDAELMHKFDIKFKMVNEGGHESTAYK